MYGLMTTPVIEMPGQLGLDQHEYGYGFGLIIHRADGHDFIGHGGSTVGFRSIMITDQTDGLGVVILCNGAGGDLYLRPPSAAAIARRPDPEAPTPDLLPRYAGRFVARHPARP